MTFRRFPSIPVALALALLVGGGARAGDPEDLYDASDRLVESVEEDGVRVQYIYNAEGVLIEARYSDGRIVAYPPEPESGSETRPEN